MVEVFKRNTVFKYVSSTYAWTAKFESVTVTVAIASAISCISVSESDTVSELNYTNRTCCFLSIEIPSVIGVVIWHTAFEYISFTACKFCCKSVCIFHCSIIAVVICCTVLDEIVWRPLWNVCVICICSAYLKTSILIIVKYTHLNDIVASGENHAIVAGFLNLNTIPVPVATLHRNASVWWSNWHSSEIKHSCLTRSRRYCLVCWSCTTIRFRNYNCFVELINAALKPDYSARLNIFKSWLNWCRIWICSVTISVWSTEYYFWSSYCSLLWWSWCCILSCRYSRRYCCDRSWSCCNCNCCYNRWIWVVFLKSASDCNYWWLIIYKSTLKALIYCIAYIINRIVKLPLEVAAIYSSGFWFYYWRNISRCISCIFVHNWWSIEVVITCASLKCLNTRRNLICWIWHFISVKTCIVIWIFYITLCINENIVERFDDTAVFTGKSSFTHGICSLHWTHHRVRTVSEIVAVNKSRCSHCYAYSVLGISVKIVIVDMNWTCSDSRMTRVWVIIPVVVVCDIVLCAFTLHTLKITFSIIPEVIVGMSNICRSFCIECTVALCLISIRTCISIEEITVVNPYMIICLLKSAVITFGTVTVHKTYVSHFNVWAVL